MDIKDYPEVFFNRCIDAGAKNDFGYLTFHKLVNNNWMFLKNNSLDYRVYAGLCLNG